MDFHGWATAVIYSVDANGHSTFASFNAHTVRVGMNSPNFYGYLPTAASYTATLTRGAWYIDIVRTPIPQYTNRPINP